VVAFVGCQEINCREGDEVEGGPVGGCGGGEAQQRRVRDLIFGEFLKRKKRLW